MVQPVQWPGAPQFTEPAQHVKKSKDSYDLHKRGPKKDQAFQVNTESARFIFRTEIGYILKRRLI